MQHDVISFTGELSSYYGDKMDSSETVVNNTRKCMKCEMKSTVVKGTGSSEGHIDLGAQGIVCGAMGFRLGLSERKQRTIDSV